MIKKLLSLKLNKKDFQEKVNKMHAYDIAKELLELTPLERKELYNLLSTERLGNSVLEPGLLRIF